MKENIKRLCLLSLVLITITLVIILVFGRTYTLNIKLNGIDNYKVSVDNETGEVEVLEEKEVEDHYIIKVKAKKPGKVYIDILSDEYHSMELLYVHKSMIITYNTYFGKSTASEIIPISCSIFLIYALYLLIKKYKLSKKANPYQYKNIAYLGIIIFLSFFIIDTIYSLLNYQGLFETINNTIRSISLISIVLFPASIITSILVTISNINLIRKEGKSFKNLLGVFLGIFICVLTVLPDHIYSLLLKSGKVNIYNLNSIGPYLYNFFETLIYLIISYLECVLIATIITAVKSIRKKVEMNKDYMIILGCKIRSDGSLTPLLKGRVDKALKFRNDQLNSTGKDLIFIPSGGKGNDEIISEAEAMKNYLLEQGIEEKNILVENKSKNTYENIKFSNKLIKEKNANIGFSTTNYHVLRAGLLATEQGLKLEGIGSKTKAYFWINAFIREFIGTLYSERKRHIILFSLILVIIAIMIGITYIANNI